MTDLNEGMASAMAEANGVFAKLAKVLDQTSKREGSIKVLDVARQAGLEIDERTLGELRIPLIVYVHPWLPWHYWFPWRPLWCWWWNRRYYWYDCCPWWWNRCSWGGCC
jgi:hypothetical protein